MINVRSIELKDSESLMSLFYDSGLMLEIKSSNQKNILCIKYLRKSKQYFFFCPVIVQKINFKKGKVCTDGMSSKSEYSIKTSYWMEWHISCTYSDISWL